MDKQDIEPILSLLRGAVEAERFLTWRSRFASEEQFAVEEPLLKRRAYVSWMLAKETITSNIDPIIHFIANNESNLSTEDLQNIKSAIEVIKREMDQELENMILQKK